MFKLFAYFFIGFVGFALVLPGCSPHTETTDTSTAAKPALYQCPMHPEYTSDKPGECPICHMRLVLIDKKVEAPTTASGIPGYAPVQITDAQIQMLGVKTLVVEGHRIPLTAVMNTGKRQIVYVAQEAGHYLPREIRTGREFGDAVEVLSGLQNGEAIVTSANFLIDSESRIKGALR